MTWLAIAVSALSIAVSVAAIVQTRRAKRALRQSWADLLDGDVISPPENQKTTRARIVQRRKI